MIQQFLSLLVHLCHPKIIVEIGTSVGYSTLWLGLAARDIGGNVITYEIDEDRVKIACNNFERVGLQSIIEVKNLDPRIDTLPIIDFVFIDAEKVDYLSHFQIIYPKLSSFGVVVADNVTSHANELESYINYVRNLPDCISMLLDIGRGLEITYKKRFVTK
ncbi:MAG: O-methyltransferase [Candidatus Hodarchaeales archaeon]